MKRLALIALTLASTAAACSKSDSITTPDTTTSQTAITDVLTGTVGVPVNGVRQKDVTSFTVGQGGGSVTISLTSAIETLPNGQFLTTVNMGLDVGTLTGTTCTLIANASALGAGGATQLGGNLVTGTYCVQVSDITNQIGPVSYAVAVVHP